MGYYFLLIVLTLATFSGVVATGALLVQLLWPRLSARFDGMLPPARGRALLMLRAFPVFAASLAALFCAASFVAFEPIRTLERPGVILVAAALGAVCLGLLALMKTGRAWARSITCSRLARHCGRLGPDGESIMVVDSPYPLAAVTGVFRPRLILSDALITACTVDELGAIFAHEAAHVNRADNLSRGLMLLLPDPMWFLRAGREIERAWSAAAEEAADDAAGAGIAERRVALASALVRVAALARTPPPGWMPDLAFFQGDNLERRVRRLLGPGTPDPLSFDPLGPCALVALVLTLGCAAFQAAAFHGLMESAIRILP
jgi:hypothetical protein